MRAYCLPLVIGMCLAMASCLRMGESSIKLPANPVLSGGLGWGVVKDSYVRLKDSPSASSRDLDHLRRGGVYALEARVLGSAEKAKPGEDANPAPTIWYSIASEGSKGWIRESELAVYASEAQAERAAKAYR